MTTALGDTRPTSAGAAIARVSAVGAIVAAAFSAPAAVRLMTGRLAPTESRLGDAVVSAFGGVTLPILAAAIAATALGAGSHLRARADRRVAAGLEPTRAVAAPVVIAVAGAMISAAVVGALVVVLLRVALGLRGMLIYDAFATAWGNALGAAAWSGIALAFVMRGGRAARAYWVIAIDLATRLLPGALAWIAPSAHVGNVLGAPPPRGFVHVPVLPQLASVLFLILLAAVSVAFALRRYRGAPAR